MSEKTIEKKKQSRQAIYVHVPVFKLFKEAAEKDGRQYSQFLEMILLERSIVVKKKK